MAFCLQITSYESVARDSLCTYGVAAPPGEEDGSSALSDLQQEHRGDAPPHQDRGQPEGIRKAYVQQIDIH